MRKLVKSALGLLATVLESILRGLRGSNTRDSEKGDSDTPILEVLISGRLGPLHAKYLIRGVIGTRLVGLPVDGSGQGERLIDVYEAVDKDHFYRLLRRFRQGGMRLIWEDTREEVGDEMIP